ncbi:MAG TPA: hypothetical protein VND66_07230 [Acidobacteriaceae bacterium]|nr:hypothetical protein [Terriglobia bacterium]HVC90398.1 hypothetical protein [Acidobacteriaceae bacterium]
MNRTRHLLVGTFFHTVRPHLVNLMDYTKIHPGVLDVFLQFREW